MKLQVSIGLLFDDRGTCVNNLPRVSGVFITKLGPNSTYVNLLSLLYNKSATS